MDNLKKGGFYRLQNIEVVYWGNVASDGPKPDYRHTVVKTEGKPNRSLKKNGYIFARSGTIFYGKPSPASRYMFSFYKSNSFLGYSNYVLLLLNIL